MNENKKPLFDEYKLRDKILFGSIAELHDFVNEIIRKAQREAVMGVLEEFAKYNEGMNSIPIEILIDRIRAKYQEEK